MRYSIAGSVGFAAVALAACQGFPVLESATGDTAVTEKTVVTDDATNAKPIPPPERTNTGGVPLLSDAASVKRAQARLAELGFAPGPVDGIAGSRTKAAVGRYEAAKGLPVTGRLTAPLLKRLLTDAAPHRDGTTPDTERTTDDLPAYRVGTSFIYSDRSVDRVVDIDESGVKWRRSDGVRYSAPRNFLLPHRYWATGEMRGKANVDGNPDSLWPRREGTEIAFTSFVAVQRAGSNAAVERRVERWRCGNEGNREIDVPAGTFRTVLFVCRRDGAGDEPDLVRAWHYAPALRHYVRYIENDRRRDVNDRIDLVAVKPGADGWPPIVRAALARAVVRALETAEVGSRSRWTSSGVDTEVTIEAGSRFVDTHGRPCRRFAQTWSADGRSWSHPAMACRTAPGSWRIPGIYDDDMLSLATSAGTS